MVQRRISHAGSKPTIQQTQATSIENNFTGGLKTEFTGLNFPENACTAVDNCVFTIVGDVTRRAGIDFETNAAQKPINTANASISTHRWLNAGGDGNTEILVVQVGNILSFFTSSAATPAAPLSTKLIPATVDLTVRQVAGTPSPSTVECQFADGNGYLFVFHPYCEPFYVTYQTTSGGVSLTSAAIAVQIRDFLGYTPEPGNPAVTARPTTLTNEHSYNLQNQGWTNNSIWSTNSTTSNLSINGTALNLNPVPGSYTWTVAAGLTITNGTSVNLTWSCPITYTASGDGQYNTTAHGSAVGTVTSYSGTTLVLTIIGQSGFDLGSGAAGINSKGTENWSLQASNLISTISTWFTAVGNYPSNADIWWQFKDTGTLSGESGVPSFNPAVTLAQVGLSTTQAPQGHFVLDAFNQQQASTSGITSLTPITTTARPKTGAWFQGRVWYAGVDSTQPPTGDAPFYTWTENIYFSQIVTNTTNFGQCYQNNDPTSADLFDLLPTDGGVIVIQGAGSINKLFPMQNGLLVFADNGVWLITGNSGLGFIANDYSVNKISAVKSISGNSYVDVLGLPIFWNEEGIYAVEPSKDQIPYGHGGINVNPITVGTIKSFYDSIPLDSKRFVKGAYNPIGYTISWTYRSIQETGISDRYHFDRVLNLNLYNKAFYPYTIGNNTHCFVNGIVYIDYPAGQINPTFKYLTSVDNKFTFSEELDDVNWVDFFSFDSVGVNYTSSFTTGYKLHGQAIRRFQPLYVLVYSRNTEDPNGYNISAIWDYSNLISSQQQTINNADPSTNMTFRRHKLRGHGYAFQINLSSINGMPFDIMGWSMLDAVNASV